MFGYITIDRSELKGKHLDRYHAYYCGVCRDLKERCGEGARLTLTYDMTFLAILLSDLYDAETSVDSCRCILHPGQKKSIIRNEYTAYAADMNLILVYHNLEDDWIDDRKKRSYLASRYLRRDYLKVADKYPRQVRAVRKYLRDLHDMEQSHSGGLEDAAIATGIMMAEIFAIKEDVWSDHLREMGAYIGRFIYLMDAYDDLEKDRVNHNYNPLTLIAKDADYEEQALRLLTVQAAGAARAFEVLPVVEEVDILRNIMYCGIWTKYRAKKANEEKKNQ